MDISLAKVLVSHFDQRTFCEFFRVLLHADGQHAETLFEIDDLLLEVPPERFYQSASAFFMCFSPYSIIKDFDLKKIDIESCAKRINNYINKRTWRLWLPVDGVALYLINNFDSELLGTNDEGLLSFYEEQLLKEIPTIIGNKKHYPLGIGNVNTFFNSTNERHLEALTALEEFLLSNQDDLRINISENGLSASPFLSEREFDGIIAKHGLLVQPTIVRSTKYNKIFDEFNNLINSDVKEKVLEDFFRTYYKEIFGYKYDGIFTQPWLRVPELDIGGKSRRLDIFVRNAVINDWELFELKRANARLTRTVTDVPVFTAAVMNAIEQAKNYKALLAQDKVKKAFLAQGIEYFEPEINLVIGRTPSISHAQWRRLLANNENGLKILTHDVLINEAKARLLYAEKALNSTIDEEEINV